MRKATTREVSKRLPAKPEPTGAKSVMDGLRDGEGGFPVVGIGSSAGGLEALERFFANVPANSGMAFVVIQHLDPTHNGILVEILQRASPIPVIQATDGLGILPDHVYVIPRNKDMSILRGVLHLFAPVAARGLRLPIDFFLRSLAADQRELAVAVILSGMGSDGSLGLRAIKEKDGAVFVQEPSSAKFRGMPGSAVKSGLVDIVAPVEELPAKIQAYLEQTPRLVPTTHPVPGGAAEGGLEKVVIVVRDQTGHDFSLYKQTTIARRIQRRMGIHQIREVATYVRYLQENPSEVELLFKELLIGVTNFFRDPELWEQLKSRVIPELFMRATANRTLRAWVPACSSGEEAYSLAIVFREAMEQIKRDRRVPVQIFATDLDRDAVAKARDGYFAENIVADVSPERLSAFFDRMQEGYRISKSIREMVVFAPQDVLMDPPFTRIDILCCRNLLIYLTPPLQKKLLSLFHYSLNPGGFLFLGNSEGVGGSTAIFAPLESKSRIYRRLEVPPGSEPLGFPPALGTRRTAPLEAIPWKREENLQSRVDQLLLRRYSPSAVLTNPRGDVLYISGRTGKYLEPAAGKANWNIHAMAREGLRSELTGAYRRALQNQTEVVLEGLAVRTEDGAQTVDVTVQSLSKPAELKGLVLVVFSEVATPPTRAKHNSNVGGASGSVSKMKDLEAQLEKANQELGTVREEMQTSAEELRSANEELQSMNEELQSNNEELTTSKEEMQSLNEELQTVNHELQARVDELSRVGSDMKNLLDSTRTAVLFLDNSLHVLRFTAKMGRISKLIPSDLGRLITDIASPLVYPELAADVEGVLRTLAIAERTVAAGDHWYQARIIPYRTQENRIEGAVITFNDVTTSKSLELELRRTQTELENRMAAQVAKLGRASGKTTGKKRAPTRRVSPPGDSERREP